jgi:hypothetical protein
MDYFEGIVRTALEADGYWVRSSFKVNLSKDEKRAVGKHSMPRPEIDLLAFRPTEKLVVALEAKSYLDSPGVHLEHLRAEHAVPEGRYKLVTCKKYRETVLTRLRLDLSERGMLGDDGRVVLGLVAGNVYRNREAEVRTFMESKGWFFWGPSDIRAKVRALADTAYENDPAVLTAKLLARG